MTGSASDTRGSRPARDGERAAPVIDCREQVPVENVLVLKEGRMFAMLDSHGDIHPPGHCGLGLYRDDTRFLSQHRLVFENAAAALLSSTSAGIFEAQLDFSLLPAGYVPPDPSDAVPVHLSREILIADGYMERVNVQNFARVPVELRLRLDFGCDFADMFEVRGWTRPGRGTITSNPPPDGRHAERWYAGVDGASVGCALDFDAPPDELTAGSARWILHLPPSGRRSIGWTVVALDDPDPANGAGAPTGPDDAGGAGAAPRVRAGPPMEARRTRLRSEYVEWRSGCTRWISDDLKFNRALEQATNDLRALHIEADGGPIVAAGIPWYSTAFGRDALITSLQTLPLNPEIARRSLRFLAHHQGTKHDEFTGEQPGKIMHEIRRGELARAREIPHLPYYGTIDATLLWITLLHEVWRWTADDTLIDDLFPCLTSALTWLERHADMDGDGLVEYAGRTENGGLLNQGWKDSLDGVSFPDGEPAAGPIALIEVQGYAYDAAIRAGRLIRHRGDLESARRLDQRAAELKRQVMEKFWLEDADSFALALDGQKRPVPTLTSNAGHLLWSRLPNPPVARRLLRTLMREDSFNGWGLRTLSDRHTVYNPMSYHNGSVWPHDNALVGLGMSFYGDTESATRILEGQFAAAQHFENDRLPELFCGFSRSERPQPVAYPVSCTPQAWAAGALFMLLQAATGLLPDAAAGVLHIREPMLPSFLSVLRVEGLQVGGTQVTLEFQRRHGRTTAVVLGLEGDPLRVEIRAC